MNHFCTLFDSNYLARGLALYQSLITTKDEFTLYVFCFDDQTFEILAKLSLPYVVPIHLKSFETDALLRVKSERTAGEYCWTCTPHVIRHVLEHYKVEQVTYLDADLYFYDKPSILLNELVTNNSSVLITEHRYTPKYNHSKLCGIYCVQFMTFNANSDGINALQWWQDRCLEWCFNRHEDGKFGDQKYLDDWPTRFKGVHVLEHLGGGVAPWNVQQYLVSAANGRPYVNQFPIVFYHFQEYKYAKNGVHDFVGGCILSKEAIEILYKPYGRALLEAYALIYTVSPNFDKGWSTFDTSLKAYVLYLKRILKGVANRYKIC